MTAARDRFKTAAGRLTPYALACGYIETRKLAFYADATVTFWHEHGALHVRAHDRENGKRLFWATPETVSQARQLFDMAEIIADAAKAGDR